MPPSHMAEKAQAVKADGVYINLERLEGANLPSVAAWLQECAGELKERGMELLLRLPEMVKTVSAAHSVLAVLPGAKIAVTPDSEMKDDANIEDERLVDVVDVPDIPDEELPLFYMISHVRNPDQKESRRVRIRRLEDEGWAAYKDQNYRRALNLWSEWLKEEPDNAKVLMLLGDVELALGAMDSALNYYDRSLEVDPGQFSLVVRRAEVLEKAGRVDEARESLNLYSRLFPGNTQVLTAQIYWLLRRDRSEEAVALIDRLLEYRPDDMEAMALRMRFLPPESSDYRAAITSLTDWTGVPNDVALFARNVRRNELLSLPYSGALQEKLDALFTNTAVAAAIPYAQQLRLRTQPVQTTFPDGLIASPWDVSGAGYTGTPGAVRLEMLPGHAEGSLKLSGTTHWQNSFVEAVIAKSSGNVWLYARRNIKHSVRFGISEKGMLHLQVWRDGVMVEQRTRPWVSTEEPVALRLVVNSHGAMGFVDGEPIADSQLYIPQDIPYGWNGIAINRGEKDEPGTVTLYELAAGPLPLRVAMLNPAASSQSFDSVLEALRAEAACYTAVSPACYSSVRGRQWVVRPDVDLSLLRLFASYYRLWLLPSVTLDTLEGVSAEFLMQQADQVKSDGFILLFRTMPEEKLMQQLSAALQFSSLKIIVAVMDDKQLTVQGLAGGRDLISTENGRDILPMEMPEGQPKDPLEWKPVAVLF